MSYSARDLDQTKINGGKFLTFNCYISELEPAFKSNNIPFTEENINIFLANGGAESLRAQLVETTWTALDDTVTNMENKFNK